MMRLHNILISGVLSLFITNKTVAQVFNEADCGHDSNSLPPTMQSG